jgi:hypothetical protein
MPASKPRAYLIEVPLIYIPLWGMQHEIRIGFELSQIESFAQMPIAQQSRAKNPFNVGTFYCMLANF